MRGLDTTRELIFIFELQGSKSFLAFKNPLALNDPIIIFCSRSVVRAWSGIIKIEYIAGEEG